MLSGPSPHGAATRRLVGNRASRPPRPGEVSGPTRRTRGRLTQVLAGIEPESRHLSRVNAPNRLVRALPIPDQMGHEATNENPTPALGHRGLRKSVAFRPLFQRSWLSCRAPGARSQRWGLGADGGLTMSLWAAHNAAVGMVAAIAAARNGSARPGAPVTGEPATFEADITSVVRRRTR